MRCQCQMYLSDLCMFFLLGPSRLQLYARFSFSSSLDHTPLLFPACQARQYFLRGGAFKGALIGCIFLTFPQVTPSLHVVLSINHVMVNLSSKWDRFWGQNLLNDCIHCITFSCLQSPSRSKSFESVILGLLVLALNFF